MLAAANADGGYMSIASAHNRLQGRTFALFSAQMHCLMLNDLVAPVLLENGARVRRIYACNVVPERWAKLGFCPVEKARGLPLDAIFTVDGRQHKLPTNIPVITLPHATWNTRHIESLLSEYRFYVPTSDYYCVQDSLAKNSPALEKGLISTRRDDFVTLLPIGSLKIDTIAEEYASTPDKNAILICLGGLRYQSFAPELLISSLDAAVNALLGAFGRHQIVLRPFPGDEAHDSLLSIRQKHALNPRFIYDHSDSTRHWMKHSAVVISRASTTGRVFSMATGRPHIALDPRADADRDALSYAADTPEALCEAVERALRQQPEPDFKKSSGLYRAGHAKQLLVEYLQKILNNDYDERWLRVAVKNPQLPSMQTESDQLLLFSAALKTNTLETCRYFISDKHHIWHQLNTTISVINARIRQNQACLLICNFQKKFLQPLSELHLISGNEVIISNNERNHSEPTLQFLRQHCTPVPCDLDKAATFFLAESQYVLIAPPSSTAELFKAWLINFCRSLADLPVPAGSGQQRNEG